MQPIIKPVFYLMNHLSYRGKFILICSVFAIPLAAFAIQLANSYHQQAEQANITREGLSYIQEVSLLVQDLETFRDLKVITSWSAYPAFEESYKKRQEIIINKVEKLINSTASSSNKSFLIDLKHNLKLDDNAKGIEAGSIDAVYDDAQAILDNVYNWRTKLSYSFISFSRNNKHILSIINLLNDSDVYIQLMGKARTYGSLYLAQGYVDSYGSQVLEKTYQELSQLIALTDLKESEYELFFKSYPQAKLTTIKKSLIEGRELFYQKLIMSPAATSDPQLYFKDLSHSFNYIYQHNKSLLDLSSEIVEEDYRKSQKQLWVFYLSAICISLLIIYLAIGLYYSISITIRELLRSAAFFAAGKYDIPVNIISHDELTAVAEAMDSMRLNIKDREQKLALMSQTDGLTQLSNRKFFDQALQISLANSRRNLTPLTVVMMDIDFFKKVNDEYGHLAGDDCLIKIAKLMQSQFKRQTDVVARYGGEEFIAILYGQGLEEATAQTEKLRSIIESTSIVSSGYSFKVTASFGLACLKPPEEATTQDIIALADALLYKSKDSGRNQVNSAYYTQTKT
jgi:diguanylate cyclase (GGDEF)-like protein